MKADIITILSIYLIRPQQRRIFALFCMISANGITQGVYKGIAEYCNSLRKLRDISGCHITHIPVGTDPRRIISNEPILYYDVYGYSRDKRNITHYYKNKGYHFAISKNKRGDFMTINCKYDKKLLFDICTNYNITCIKRYNNSISKYNWDENRIISYTFKIREYNITVCEYDIIIYDYKSKYTLYKKI
jgi:hypothetical protein